MFKALTRKLAWTALSGVIFVCSVISSLLLAQHLEYVYLPVVVNFKVDKHEILDENLVLQGHMSKVRDCRFVEVVAYHGDEYLSLKFEQDGSVSGRSRAEGWQAWGPWAINPAVQQIKFVVRHQCHVLWDSRTILNVDLR